MIKVIIFGTSGGAQRVLDNIVEEETEVVAFADNNPEKQNTFYSWDNGDIVRELKIISPADILAAEYDYIIVASTYYEIVDQLVQLTIEKDRIIPYFKLDRIGFRKYRNIFYLEKIFIEQLEEKMEHRFKNLPYELDDLFDQKRIKRFDIRSAEETMEKLLKEKKSICRFGDGELGQILGIPIGFQPYDKNLAVRLKEIIKNPLDECLVALPAMDYFEDELRPEYHDFWRGWLYQHRKELYDIIPINNVYYDSFITRSPKYFPDFFNLFKNIWDDRDVVLIEGKETRFGVGNDLLDNVRSITRVLGPSENAFKMYNQIYHYCKTLDRNVLVLISLGPAATVLAYDLAKSGFQAIDIGHLDLEYEWYLHSEGRITNIENKYVNEINRGNIVDSCSDPAYLSQITMVIE